MKTGLFKVILIHMHNCYSSSTEVYFMQPLQKKEEKYRNILTFYVLQLSHMLAMPHHSGSMRTASPDNLDPAQTASVPDVK